MIRRRESANQPGIDRRSAALYPYRLTIGGGVLGIIFGVGFCQRGAA